MEDSHGGWRAMCLIDLRTHGKGICRRKFRIMHGHRQYRQLRYWRRGRNGNRFRTWCEWTDIGRWCHHCLRSNLPQLRSLFDGVLRPGRRPAAGRCHAAGAWYVNTCANGSATGQATGVVWLTTGQPAPRSRHPIRPSPRPRRRVSCSYRAHPDPQPVDNGLREPGRVALDHVLDVAFALHDGPGLQRRWMRGRHCHGHPSYVTWNTGDGSTVTCNGPGTTYDTALPASSQSTTCSHTYTTTSAGQPSPNGNPNDAAFPITATITWSIAWTGPNGSAGVLPSLTTQGATSLEWPRSSP